MTILPSRGHRLFPARPLSSVLPFIPTANPRSCYRHSQDSESTPLPAPPPAKREIFLAPQKPTQGRPRRPRSGALRLPSSSSAPPPPGSTPRPLPGNRRLGGVPGAESSCLFKRPWGAPHKPPGAGGGGHGRGRLAPGGRGSTTKLRPLSLRIGRAPQTGGGRALSRPSLSQAVLGPGVGRARASRPPAGGCAPSVRSALPTTRKSGGGWPRPGGALVPSHVGPPVCPWPRNISRRQGPLLGPSPGWASRVSLLCVTGCGSACARVHGLRGMWSGGAGDERRVTGPCRERRTKDMIVPGLSSGDVCGLSV